MTEEEKKAAAEQYLAEQLDLLDDDDNEDGADGGMEGLIAADETMAAIDERLKGEAPAKKFKMGDLTVEITDEKPKDEAE